VTKHNTKCIQAFELESLLSKLDSDFCFCLTTKRNPKGYPIVLLGSGKSALAQTFVYKHFIGRIPIFGHNEVHHSCKTKKCVNPKHLKLLSRKEHAAIHAGRFCRHGHERTPENIYFDSHGWQSCRQCRIDNEARRPLR